MLYCCACFKDTWIVKKRKRRGEGYEVHLVVGWLYLLFVGYCVEDFVNVLLEYAPCDNKLLEISILTFHVILALFSISLNKINLWANLSNTTLLVSPAVIIVLKALNVKPLILHKGQ